MESPIVYDLVSIDSLQNKRLCWDHPQWFFLWFIQYRRCNETNNLILRLGNRVWRVWLCQPKISNELLRRVVWTRISSRNKLLGTLIVQRGVSKSTRLSKAPTMLKQKCPIQGQKLPLRRRSIGVISQKNCSRDSSFTL